MAVDSLWNKVRDYWRRSNVPVRAGATALEIAAFEEKYGVVLQCDVREYFCFADGTGDDLDDELVRFWPLAEVQPVHEFLDSDRVTYPDRYAYPDCYVFADYCYLCFSYAVLLTSHATQLAPVFRVTGGSPPGEQIASSFREFMERYAANPGDIL